MKNKIFALFVFVFIFSGLSSQERILTHTDKILGLSRLWEGVRSNYVYYDKLQFDWDSLYAVSISKVSEIEDTYDYLRELERIAASVGDGHTYVRHRGEPLNKDRITPAPFSTRLVGNKVFVDEVWHSELVNKGIVRGTEVISINGQDVFVYAKNELGQYTPSSTPQWLFWNTMNGFELTKAKRNEPISIEFKNNNKVFTVSYADRNVVWDIQQEQRNKERENGAASETRNETLNFTLMDNNIGLLKINHFNDKEFNRKFDELYADITATSALVIDLRGNDGGNSLYADYVLRHLSDKPIKTSSWSSRMYIPAHASWNYSDEWYTMASSFIYPLDEDIYKEPIVVLVNAGTFSSAEDFCVKFRGMKRGKIIGTPTGGSTGNGVRITLIEDMAWANICAKKDVAPDGTVFVGVGIIPDIECNETKESFMTRDDIVLKKAIAEVKK